MTRPSALARRLAALDLQAPWQYFCTTPPMPFGSYAAPHISQIAIAQPFPSRSDRRSMVETARPTPSSPRRRTISSARVIRATGGDADTRTGPRARAPKSRANPSPRLGCATSQIFPRRPDNARRDTATFPRTGHDRQSWSMAENPFTPTAIVGPPTQIAESPAATAQARSSWSDSSES